MTSSKELTKFDPSADAVYSAIAEHLKNAAALMASQRASSVGGSINEAQIIVRLDRILAKLGKPAEYPISWVKLEKYVELTGDTVDAVMGRRKLGKWLEGHQCKIVDGRLWIDLRAAQHWVEKWDAKSPMLASWCPPSNKPKK